MAKFCTNCGNPLSDEAVSCEKCGHIVEVKKVQKKKSSRWKTALLGVLIGYLILNAVSCIFSPESASDAKYISCAKTLIEDTLKNPSSVQYNSEKVVEKDKYGRAIVYLNLSAQNGFGGWVRKGYYVCIQSINNDGTFSYHPYFSYVSDDGEHSSTLLKVFRSSNNFGEPRDKKQ